MEASDRFRLKHQCDECPWRKDQPPGRFPAARFKALATSCEQGFFPMFACHKTESTELACVGYLACPDSENNFLVRMALIRGCFDPRELVTKGEQYESYEELMEANDS